MFKKITTFVFIALLAFSVIGYAQTGTFSGTVTDESGLAIAGASISLNQCGGGGGGGGGWGGGWGNNYYTQSLEDGSFIIEDVDAGNYNASASAFGYMMDFEQVEITAGQTTTVDFVLEEWGWGGGGGAEGVCMGTVTDEAGLPIEGASVHLSHFGPGWGGNYQTFTGEDGTFLFEEVEVGDYNAQAMAMGYMMEMQQIEIVEAETTVVNFVLEEFGGGGGGAEGVCMGAVTDEAGLPIEGASVHLNQMGGGWGGNYQTFTGEDGTFLFEEVEVGDYNAQAMAMGYMMEMQQIEIAEAETTVVNFVLEEFGGGGGGAEGVCMGAVTDEAGLPIEGASVHLNQMGGGWGGNYQTFTGEDGTFLFEEVDVGDYNAQAMAMGYMMEMQQIEIVEAETTVVNFVLEEFGGGGGGPTGTCAGTVTDEAGLPIEGASVHLSCNGGGGGGGWGGGWGWGGNNYTAFTLEDGSYIIEDVEVDEYTATAFAWGYEMASQEVEILEGQTTTADFTLESWGGTGPYGTLSGVVTDTSGAAVEGAFVSVHSLGGGWGWGWGWGGNWYSAITQEDGSFIIDEVEVGEYIASAHAWGIGWDSQEVEILEGDTTTVTFTLEQWGGPGGFDVLELTGTTLINSNNIYGLDTNGDNRPDYSLNFGPAWYNPPSGALRPAYGEQITVVGSILGHNAVPAFVVYDKNNAFWRDPLETSPGLMKRLHDRQYQEDVTQQLKVVTKNCISNYPNPFNPETMIDYTLKDGSKVNITVYNSLGQKVAELVDGYVPAGSYQVKWNGLNYASGFYFLKMQTAEHTITQKILLAK